MNPLEKMMNIFLVVSVLGITHLFGFAGGENKEQKEVCPCKYCANWREKRDADDKLIAAKEPKLK